MPPLKDEQGLISGKKIAQMPATLANKADVFRVPGIVWNFKLSSPQSIYFCSLAVANDKQRIRTHSHYNLQIGLPVEILRPRVSTQRDTPRPVTEST